MVAENDTASTTPYSLLIEFIEVLLDSFLYGRHIYPESFFISATRFGIPIWKCRHPVICGYVQTLLASIGKLIKANAMSTFSIIRSTKEKDIPVERLSIMIHSIQNTFNSSEHELVALRARLQTFIWKVLHSETTTATTKESTLFNKSDFSSPFTFYTLVTLRKENQRNMNIDDNFFSPSVPWYAINDEPAPLNGLYPFSPFKVTSINSIPNIINMPPALAIEVVLEVSIP